MLWPLFNTIQLMMALVYMNMTVPANITFFSEVINDIINFQLIKKEKVYDFIFTKEEEKESSVVTAEPLDYSGEETSPALANIVLNSILFILILIILVLLIVGLVLFKRQIAPKCPNFVQKMVDII